MNEGAILTICLLCLFGSAGYQGKGRSGLFSPGDVPLFSHYSVTAMNEYMDQYPCGILPPTAYNGRQGHPVLFY